MRLYLRRLKLPNRIYLFAQSLLNREFSFYEKLKITICCELILYYSVTYDWNRKNSKCYLLKFITVSSIRHDLEWLEIMFCIERYCYQPLPLLFSLRLLYSLYTIWHSPLSLFSTSTIAVQSASVIVCIHIVCYSTNIFWFLQPILVAIKTPLGLTLQEQLWTPQSTAEWLLSSPFALWQVMWPSPWTLLIQALWLFIGRGQGLAKSVNFGGT